jgi:nitrite reductase/ring-hydroxylating ferredoxin subunit
VDSLAAIDDDNADATISAVIDGYTALGEVWVLPKPEEIFAVGYSLGGGHGRSVLQCAEGVANALPATWTALGSDGLDAVAAWLTEDRFERVAIGRRFAFWLSENADPRFAEQAAFEAAVAHALPADAATITLGAQAGPQATWHLAKGVELVCAHHEVELNPETVAERGIEALDSPMHLAIFRAADGEVQVAELASEVFAALQSGADTLNALEPDVLRELAALGMLQPDAWRA